MNNVNFHSLSSNFPGHLNPLLNILQKKVLGIAGIIILALGFAYVLYTRCCFKANTMPAAVSDPTKANHLTQAKITAAQESLAGAESKETTDVHIGRSSLSTEEMIGRHQLQKIGPEGIWFNETYRSSILVIPGTPYQSMEKRSAGAQIEFLLAKGHVSIWHQQKCDETWTYLAGSSLHLHIINKEGIHALVKLGNPEIHPDHLRHYTIKSEGQYIAAELPSEAEGDYFFGTSMTFPGFQFEDADFAVSQTLLEKFPEHRELILRLATNPH